MSGGLTQSKKTEKKRWQKGGPVFGCSVKRRATEHDPNRQCGQEKKRIRKKFPKRREKKKPGAFGAWKLYRDRKDDGKEKKKKRRFFEKRNRGKSGTKPRNKPTGSKKENAATLGRFQKKKKGNPWERSPINVKTGKS